MFSDKTARRLALWAGYQSYDYISPSPSVPVFDYVVQVDRVAESVISWDAKVEEKAQAIEASGLVVSAHDHLSLRPEDPRRFAEYRRSGREATPYEGIARSGVDIFFDGGPAAVSMIRSHTPFDWDDAISDLGMRQADWAHQKLVRQITSMADVGSLADSGQIGIVSTLESATSIGNDLDRLDILYGLGVRLLGVVYSESNQLGSGLADVTNAGLSLFGRRAVARMNELGIMVDVSHAGDETSLDVVRHSTAPVVITHAGARALWPSSRMKSDDVIRACAESGGFIGIEAAPHTTEVVDGGPHTIDMVMRHVEYCLELVGPDHVAFGPDTNFGDHVAWHRTFAPLFGKDSDDELDDISFVRGVENPGQSVHNMIRWLVAHGYSSSEISKLAGGNVLRVASSVWVS